MKFVAIFLPDRIGDTETAVEWDGKPCGTEALLSEAKARAPERGLAAGDMVAREDDWFIVGQCGGLRVVSKATAASWRMKTPVERMIGSGEIERVKSGQHQKVACII
jgi:hypothetical protein